MGFGLIVFLFSLLLLDDSKQPCFHYYDVWGYYSTAAGPQSVIVSDIDKDGDEDLVTLSNGAIGVLKNKGDGTFASKVEYKTGRYPQSISASDLNGDGYDDLIVTNSLDHTVSVFKNKGDGTYNEKVDYNTGHFPHSAVAADINGDGRPDLIVANGSGYLGGDFPVSDKTISILMNKGNGNFKEKVDQKVGWPLRFVFACDLDGDKDVDLAVADYNSVSILKNAGDGHFAFQGRYNTGDACFSLTGSDLDGDGDIDLVTLNRGDNSISVLKNDGTGRFGPPFKYSTGEYPNSVCVSDFNGDLKPDLIISEESQRRVSVLYNQGKGNFVLGPCYETWPTSPPTSVTSADLDGDGDQDLIVTILGSNDVAIFLSPAK